MENLKRNIKLKFSNIILSTFSVVNYRVICYIIFSILLRKFCAFVLQKRYAILEHIIVESLFHYHSARRKAFRKNSLVNLIGRFLSNTFHVFLELFLLECKSNCWSIKWKLEMCLIKRCKQVKKCEQILRYK